MGFQYGKSVYPLDVGTNTSLLPVCDPALAKVLDYLRFAIRKYADPAVLAALQIPTTDVTAATIQSAVQQVVPIDPDTIARHEQFQFPLLAGWSKSTKYDDKSLNWTLDKRTIWLAYILPPLTGYQSVIWTPLLNAVSHICHTALRAGGDVDYRSGERIAADNIINSIRLVSADFGHYDFAGKQTPPYFPAWVAELELVEQQAAYTTGLTPFAGADVTITQQALDDVSTIVAANAAIGATTLQVASTDGFNALDVATVGAGTAREETVSIVAIVDATHFTVSALSFAHTSAQADVVARKPVTMLQAKSDVG